jgi:phosphoribosyl 1,2-cyclic phosphodiesterase
LSPDRTSELEALAAVEKDPLIRVRVWGARGSIPTPSSAVLKYGGNTPCVEVIVRREIGCDQRLIFDAGTGIRNLGLDLLMTKTVDCDFHIFLTHFHWDHVQGLPFFPALYNKATTITFYSSRTPEELREILWGQMATPYFPVRFDDLLATVHFVHIGETPVKLGEVEVSTFCLTHPQGAAGFRVVHKGRSVVYATDHEHGNEEADLRLLNAARGADVLFYDSQYTPEEYPSHRGWGHGTWLEATKVGHEAGVKRLVLFHHDPSHDDFQIDEILKLARAEFPETFAATEGETIVVG